MDVTLFNQYNKIIIIQSKNIFKCNIPETIKFIDERNNPSENDDFLEERKQEIQELLCYLLDKRLQEEEP